MQALYEAHARSIFSFLAFRSGDRALAEDLLSDTFERAMRARRMPMRRPASEKAWLFRIALNLLRDHARRSHAENRALSSVAAAGASATDDAVERVDLRDAVREGLATLSSEEQHALALRFGAGLTVPEIARVTNEPLPRVESRVYRSLQKLRPLLERDVDS
jgi:RNA polymerase sigma-70 factor (ECF subfamily)